MNGQFSFPTDAEILDAIRKSVSHTGNSDPVRLADACRRVRGWAKTYMSRYGAPAKERILEEIVGSLAPMRHVTPRSAMKPKYLPDQNGRIRRVR